MSKTVGKILAVAAVAVAIIAIPPVGAAIGISAATAAIISAGVAAATLLNSAALASKAKNSLQQRQASVTALQLGEVAREAVFGTTMTGGSLADAFNYGGQYGTDWECQIIALADHRCDALVGFYVNDTYVEFTGNGVVAGYNGQLEVHWQPGTEDQAVPAIVTANGPGWTANDNGAGVCWVAVTYRADKADAKNPIWTAGRPRFTWVLRGMRCYQPRLDSSVGGSGPHRWNDPSTWTWTDNPIDCRYNWVRGIYACDRVGQLQQLLVGRGLSTVEAPPSNVFAPANVCDELVSLDAGGSEKRYRVSGVVRADEAFLDVEEHFASACGGVILQPEGAVEIEPGQTKAPVFFFSDEDLLVGSTVEYSDTLPESDAEWVNTVVPRFVDPTLKYADHAAPIRRVVSDLITDGGPRELALSLPLVTSATQAGRVGEIQRRLGRLLKRASLTLGPDFAEVEEGDWGVWTSTRYLKGASVMFRVQAYALDEKWHNRLILREISALVYARDADAASTSIALQGDDPGPVPQPGPLAWSATGGEIAKGNSAVPAITITGAADNDFADLIRFEVLAAEGVTDPASSTGWIDAGTAGPDARRHLITAVAPTTAYYCAVAYVVGRRPGPRRIIGPVTTSGTRLDFDSVTGPNKPANGADVTADNVAKDTAAIGGRPTPIVIQVLDRVPQLVAGQQLLERSVLDLDGFSRRIDQQKAVLEATLLRVIGEAGYQRSVMRDAGVVIDAATGKVTLYALDQTREQVNNALIQLDATKAQILTKVDASFVRAEIAAAQLNPEDLAALEGVIARVTSAEQRLDGLAARVETKAEAATLTALTGTVQSAVQTLDALAGEFATKVSFTEFDRATTRLGAVEQQLVAIGDVASFTITVQQAKAIGDAALFADIAGLAAADQAARRQIVAAAEARQELVTRMDDGDAVSAAATLFLTAKLGETDARAAAETLVRAGQTSALAQQNSALSAMLGSLTATVGAQAQALVDEREARATEARRIRAEFESDIATLAGATEEALTARIGAEVSNRNQAIANAAASAASATQQVRADFEPRISAAAEAAAGANGKAVEAAAAAGRADTKAGDAAAAAAQVDARVSAQVTRLDQADADERGARAAAVQQVRLEAGEALLLVDDRVDAVVDRAGRVEATRTFAVDANGRVSGWRFVGGEAGGRLLLIDADLYMGDGLIVSGDAGFEVRRGGGFGAAGNLIEWFGPSSVEIGAETIANSRWALATDGKRYNGGVDLDVAAPSPDRIRQLGLSGSTGSTGGDTQELSRSPASFPAGGKFRITGRITSASAQPTGGEVPGSWLIRFLVDYGAGPQVIAEAPCSVSPGDGTISDGVAELSGQLFTNQGSGAATLIVTARRSGPPNSGISSTWSGSAVVEWLNA